MLFYLTCVILFLLIIHLLLNYNGRARMLWKIPGPRGTFIIGNGIELLRNADSLMKMGRNFTSTWKGIFRFWSFPIGAVIVYNPEDVETITSDMKHIEKGLVYNFLKPWLRDGLLISNGEKWQQRRKLLTPAFHFNILRRYYTVLQENSQRLVQRLEKSHGESVDIVPILSEYTLHSICETAMGTQLNDDTSEATNTYKQSIHDLGKALSHRFGRLYLLTDFVFFMSLAGKATTKCAKILHEFTEKVIVNRRKEIIKYGKPGCENSDNIFAQKKKTAMLDLLLMAEKDGHIDRIGIQEEVDTFMFEGHDTTASGLTFCLMSIANDKKIQDTIYSELIEIFGESTRAATTEDLSKMKYLECCIKESLRLYPPVHYITRHLKETVQLSGYTVPAGTDCNILILDLHRNPELYADPLVFDPDRFRPENCVGRHPYAYIPFSAGPRNCIGQKFAMMELKSAVAEMLRKFELHPVTTHEEIDFADDFLLRNIGPVYVTFIKR